ncbi:MAG: LysM peptidoglycan-binding domain-containing protein, partial [Paracoccaceae bacterium]
MTTVHQTSRHTAPFQTMHRPAAHKARVAALLVTATVLSGCSDGALDLDLRGKIGNVFSTSDAARAAQAGRPDPDDRGIISYPNYQVAVARTGDTLTTVATRVGLPVDEVARYNGMKPNATLRAGEVIALPRRVAEPSPATGATGQGPIRPVSQVDITEIASVAIDNSPATPVATQPQTAATAPLVGREPIRHQVERGETAYSLSRRFGISVDTLAQWNGLDDTYTLRAGQYLLIPAADNAATQLRAPSAIVIEPGQNSITPPPPSAQSPLPTETTRPVSEADAEAEAAARAAAPALATSKPAR